MSTPGDFAMSQLTLSPAERATLQGWLRAQSLPQALALRARIVLASADGQSLRTLAKRLETSVATVCAWRRRFRTLGLVGLYSRPNSGRPRTIGPEQVTAILIKTRTPPNGSTRWSASRLAKELGLSAATILRVWRQNRLRL